MHPLTQLLLGMRHGWADARVCESGMIGAGVLGAVVAALSLIMVQLV